MTQHPWLDPNPFYFEGGRRGVLLIHGFTGAATEMRPLGEYLAKQGYTVSGILLPGHGTSVDDLAARTWPEWVAAVNEAYEELTQRCDQVFAAGLSLGSLLTMNLAADKELAGIALYSPPLMINNPLFRLSWLGQWLPLTIKSSDSDLVEPDADQRIWCYEGLPAKGVYQVNLFTKQVKVKLPQITTPTLVFMSTGDSRLKFEGGPYVIQHISSTQKELVTLHDSGHNMLVDGERDSINQQTAAFFNNLP